MSDLVRSSDSDIIISYYKQPPLESFNPKDIENFNMWEWDSVDGF